LPGAGRYNKLLSPLSISENAEFLLSHIKEESLNQKAIVSVSMGSMVAIEMLRKRPNLFLKAIVINTSFSNLSPFYHRLQLKALKQLFKIGKAKSLLEKELEIVKMVSQSSDKWPKVSQSWAKIAEKRPMRTTNFFRQLIAAGTYRLSKLPPKPPIVVLSSLKDQMVHSSCSEKLAKHWNLMIYRHPTAGHDICIDDPNWVIEKLRKVLAE